MTATDEITIDAYAVALHETINYYIKPEHRPHVRAIRGVYLFDRNSRTHCCELTPSYYLIHLYDQVIPADDTSEEQRQQLYDAYENQGGEDCYVHCSRIERLIKANDKANVCHLGKPVYRTGEPIPADELADRDAIMEDLRESYCGNPPL